MILDYALAEQQKGRSVFPLLPREKRPYSALLPQVCPWPQQRDDTDGKGKGSWLYYQTHQASEDEIREWFATDPESNYAVVTGAISGVFVLDADDNQRSEEIISDQGGCPDTEMVATANGCHRYLEHPGTAVANRVKCLPGIDIRGDGGYVVGPGCVHPSGAIYTPIDTTPPAPAPDWLLPHITPRPEPTPKPSRPICECEGDALRAGALQWLERECEKVRSAPDGAKHYQLRNSSITIGGIVGMEEAPLSADDAADSLEAAIGGRARSIKNAQKTIRAGLAYGAARPFKPHEIVRRFDEPVFNDGAACCPYHGTPLIRRRRGYSCEHEQCHPTGKRFWWAGEQYEHPEIARLSAERERKTRAYEAKKAARVEATNRHIVEMLDRAFGDARLSPDHQDILDTLTFACAGSGHCRWSVSRIARAARMRNQTAREVSTELIDWGYLRRSDVPGQTPLWSLVLENVQSAPAYADNIQAIPLHTDELSILTHEYERERLGNIYSTDSKDSGLCISVVFSQPDAQPDTADWPDDAPVACAGGLPEPPAWLGDDDGWLSAPPEPAPQQDTHPAPVLAMAAASEIEAPRVASPKGRYVAPVGVLMSQADTATESAPPSSEAQDPQAQHSTQQELHAQPQTEAPREVVDQSAPHQDAAQAPQAPCNVDRRRSHLGRLVADALAAGASNAERVAWYVQANGGERYPAALIEHERRVQLGLQTGRERREKQRAQFAKRCAELSTKGLKAKESSLSEKLAETHKPGYRPCGEVRDESGHVVQLAKMPGWLIAEQLEVVSAELDKRVPKRTERWEQYERQRLQFEALDNEAPGTRGGQVERRPQASIIDLAARREQSTPQQEQPAQARPVYDATKLIVTLYRLAGRDEDADAYLAQQQERESTRRAA